MKSLGLLFLLTCTALAQTGRDEAFRKAMEMREEMHRRLMDHLFNGDSLKNDDQIFKDMESLFNDLLTERLAEPKSKNFDMAWQESKDGRTLLLSPQNKNHPLEINVEKGMISIKGKTEEKSGGSSMVSSFTNIFSVPPDCDSTRVKMLEKDGKILMSFPFRKEAKKAIDQRKPVGPSKGDVQI